MRHTDLDNQCVPPPDLGLKGSIASATHADGGVDPEIISGESQSSSQEIPGKEIGKGLGVFAPLE